MWHRFKAGHSAHVDAGNEEALHQCNSVAHFGVSVCAQPRIQLLVCMIHILSTSVYPWDLFELKKSRALIEFCFVLQVYPIFTCTVLVVFFYLPFPAY